LERLLSMPMGKADFIFGYALAFGGFAIAQSLLVTGLAFGVFDMSVASSAWLLLLVAVADALLGTALGLFVSAFANSEFQAVQFMPAVVLPQLLLCGIIVPREDLPTPLRLLSDVLPLSYAVDATQQVMTYPTATTEYWRSLAVVGGFIVVSLALGAATLRRRTP
jgi:ABC transporter DrrB family efflux protein